MRLVWLFFSLSKLLIFSDSVRLGVFYMLLAAVSVSLCVCVCARCAHSHIELWSFSFRIIRINEHKSFGVWNYFINRSFTTNTYWFIVDSNTRLILKVRQRDNVTCTQHWTEHKTQQKKRVFVAKRTKANWVHSITKDCCSWLLHTINPYSTIQNHNTVLCFALLTQPIIIIAFSLFSLGFCGSNSRHTVCRHLYMKRHSKHAVLMMLCSATLGHQTALFEKCLRVTSRMENEKERKKTAPLITARLSICTRRCVKKRLLTNGFAYKWFHSYHQINSPQFRLLSHWKWQSDKSKRAEKSVTFRHWIFTSHMNKVTPFQYRTKWMWP